MSHSWPKSTGSGPAVHVIWTVCADIFNQVVRWYDLLIVSGLSVCMSVHPSLTQDISAPKHHRPDTCSDHISSLCVPDSKKPALIWSLKVKIYYTNIPQISLSNLDKTWWTILGTVFWCLNKLHHWLDGVRMIKGWHFNGRWRHFIFTSRLLLCCCHAQTVIFIFLYLYFPLF